MHADRPIRAAIVRPPGPPIAWHDAVADAVRAVEGVTIVDAASSPDVVIDLAPAQPARGASMERETSAERTPRLGVWRFGFGDGAPVANGAAGTWVRLYRVTADRDRAIVLHEGWYRSRTSDGWGTRSVGERVAPWCARVLRQIRLGDADVVTRPPQATRGCDDPEPLAPPARLVSAANGLVDTLRDWRRRQRWTIGLVACGVEEILQRGRLPEPTWMRGQPADRFYADPFLLDAGGDRVRLLAEEYVYASGEKRIAQVDLSRSGDILAVERPAGLPPAASYPFLLRDAGEVFCIPETFRAARASSFKQAADGWTADGELLTGFPAVDTTLLSHDGRWWLFCTKQGDEDQTELHLFMADAWRGPWSPHPLNPVKSDTRSSRPAGACFTIDGAVYRPAQNCARRYGAGLTINRIVELSPRAFREEPVLALDPSPASPWPDGLHTINSLGGVTVVDGLRVE